MNKEKDFWNKIKKAQDEAFNKLVKELLQYGRENEKEDYSEEDIVDYLNDTKHIFEGGFISGCEWAVKLPQSEQNKFIIAGGK